MVIFQKKKNKKHRCTDVASKWKPSNWQDKSNRISKLQKQTEHYEAKHPKKQGGETNKRHDSLKNMNPEKKMVYHH